MIKEMGKFIMNVFLSIFCLLVYLMLAIFPFLIIVASSFIFVFINLPLTGSILLLISNFVIFIIVLVKIQGNIDKIGWEPFKSNNLAYEITNTKKWYNSFTKISFIVPYKIRGQSQTKRVEVLKGQVYEQKITKILTEKFVHNQMQAILYKKPRSNGIEVIYRNAFSVTNIMVVALLLPIQAGLIVSSLGLYAIATINPEVTTAQTLVIVQQAPINYIYGLSALLLVLYGLFILRGIKKSSSLGFKSYPMLYDLKSGLEEDFILSFDRMSDICSQCGEILEIKEKYCSNCGMKTSVET